MKTWSKYIILIITIFAILWCKGETISSRVKSSHITLIEQLANETESLSTDFPDSRNAQLINFTNSQSLNKSTSRRDNSQRHSLYLIKVNKASHERPSYCIVDKYTSKHFFTSEPAHRLISLGKLII